MKRLVAVAVAGMVLGLAGQAMAIDIGGALQNAGKQAAKKGGQAALEGQINKDLANTTCACDNGKIDQKCLTKAAAKLKTEHALAEKNGVGDFNIYVDADKKCAKMTETQMTALVGWADVYVNEKKDTNMLTFSVKLQ